MFISFLCCPVCLLIRVRLPLLPSLCIYTHLCLLFPVGSLSIINCQKSYISCRMFVPVATRIKTITADHLCCLDFCASICHWKPSFFHYCWVLPCPSALLQTAHLDMQCLKTFLVKIFLRAVWRHNITGDGYLSYITVSCKISTNPNLDSHLNKHIS